MGINSAAVKFKNDLLALINGSGLPICIIEMVLSNTTGVVQEKLKQAVEAEKKEEESKKEVKPDE